jgi:hypothetical protein
MEDGGIESKLRVIEQRVRDGREETNSTRMSEIYQLEIVVHSPIPNGEQPNDTPLDRPLTMIHGQITARLLYLRDHAIHHRQQGRKRVIGAT